MARGGRADAAGWAGPGGPPPPGTSTSATVGSLTLPNPVMTASGTAGHADELEAYGPLAALGAVVVKSLSVDPGRATRRPGCTRRGRACSTASGLQGPGLEAWIHRRPAPPGGGRGPQVVSIWGQRVDDYAKAAGMLAGVAGLTASR